MKPLYKVLITIFFFASFSCEVTKSDTEDYINRFNENKIAFEKLAKLISSDKKLLKKIGYPIIKNKVDPEIKSELEKLDIEKFNTSETDCSDKMEIEFIANWTKNAHLYFSKNNCNLGESKKGYHSKTTMIEVWGLGNGWIMWIDYDFI